jgi:hypothetical protein
MLQTGVQTNLTERIRPAETPCRTCGSFAFLSRCLVGWLVGWLLVSWSRTSVDLDCAERDDARASDDFR